jgi:hypothetical protein
MDALACLPLLYTETLRLLTVLGYPSQENLITICPQRSTDHQDSLVTGGLFGIHLLSISSYLLQEEGIGG